jgi:O-acetyl-ADP-ribose deacetylase (regulator of RNase III)
VRVEVKQGDILAESADVLICSANIYLNQSGGVGGEILRRHGDSMQQALHSYLVKHGLNFVQQGQVVETDGGGTNFQKVLHAVAVDGWYHSSADVVADVLEKALQRAAELHAKKVAVVALATGYGRLTMREFAQGFCNSIDRIGNLQVETMVVVVPREGQAEEIRTVIAGLRERRIG